MRCFLFVVLFFTMLKISKLIGVNIKNYDSKLLIQNQSEAFLTYFISYVKFADKTTGFHVPGSIVHILRCGS